MREIETVETIRQWADAERTGDVAAVDALLADDFVGIGPYGFRLDKEAWVGRYRSGDLVNDRFDFSSTAARRFGGTVVVDGVVDQAIRYRSQPQAGTFRATVLLAGSDDRWRITHIQFSGPIPS